MARLSQPTLPFRYPDTYVSSLEYWLGGWRFAINLSKNNAVHRSVEQLQTAVCLAAATRDWNASETGHAGPEVADPSETTFCYISRSFVLTICVPYVAICCRGYKPSVFALRLTNFNDK